MVSMLLNVLLEKPCLPSAGRIVKVLCEQNMFVDKTWLLKTGGHLIVLIPQSLLTVGL